jgi:hypothetical protein
MAPFRNGASLLFLFPDFRQICQSSSSGEAGDLIHEMLKAVQTHTPPEEGNSQQ